MSDWMNWQDFMQANAPQVQAEADARQEAALQQQEQMNKLFAQLRQQQATAMSNETFGGKKYDGDITKLGSYGDLMKARDAGQTAFAQSQQAQSPWEKDMQSQMGIQPVANPWDNLNKRLGGVSADGKSWAQSREAGWKDIEARKAAEAARKAQDDQRKKAFREQVKQKMSEYWGRLDAQNDNFLGGDKRFAPNFTVYSGEGFVDPSMDSDAQQLSQMGRNAGLTTDVDRFNAPATYEWGKRTKGGY